MGEQHGTITWFYLVDADTGKEVRYLNVNGNHDGADEQIVLEQDGRNLNICVLTVGRVDAVQMGIQRDSQLQVIYPIHMNAPWCLAADENGVTYEPVPELQTPGKFTVTATPYLWHDILTGNKGQTASLSFTVVDKLVQPTLAPTSPPSVTNTFASTTLAPTNMEQALLFQETEATVDLRLDSTFGIMEAKVAEDFESITANHIKQGILQEQQQQQDDDELMLSSSLQVWASIVDQQSLQVASKKTNTRHQRRHLQQQSTASPLQVRLYVLTEYRSSNEENNVLDWIENAFHRADQRTELLEKLQQSNEFFADMETIESVRVTQGVVPLSSGTDADPAASDGVGTMVVIMALMAGVTGVLVAVLATLLLLRRKHRGSSLANTQKMTASSTPSPSAEQQQDLGGFSLGGDSYPTLPVQTEIHIQDKPDDISTLGDPSVVPCGTTTSTMATRQQQPLADAASSIVSGNTYDYAKIYMSYGGGSAVVSTEDQQDLALANRIGQGTNNNNMLGLLGNIDNDECSFERYYKEPSSATITTDHDEMNEIKFDLLVPPGKLGFVIDTATYGRPIIHALKPDSVLKGKLRQDDRLLAVDGHNVTHMSLAQVSALITAKSKQERILTIVRTRGNTNNSRP